MGYLFKFRLTLLKSFRNVNQEQPDGLKAAKRRLADGEDQPFQHHDGSRQRHEARVGYGLNVDDFTSVAGQTADIKLSILIRGRSNSPIATRFTCNARKRLGNRLRSRVVFGFGFVVLQGLLERSKTDHETKVILQVRHPRSSGLGSSLCRLLLLEGQGKNPQDKYLTVKVDRGNVRRTVSSTGTFQQWSPSRLEASSRDGSRNCTPTSTASSRRASAGPH